MYNSATGSNQDDADLTMIDSSYVYRDNDQPISNSVVKHLKQANQSKPHNQDYSHGENDRLEAAEQIERILNFYRQELKQDSITQLDCNQQLIIRLVDFIRPIYSSQKRKLENLDVLIDEIAVLQALPFIEHRDKIEQFNNEIQYLKKIIITSENDNNHSIAKAYQMNSMVNYQQWMEMEEETKKLQNLVETQRDKINELIKMLSQDDQVPTTTQQPTTCSTSMYPKIPEPVSDILPKSLVDIVTHETSNEEHHVKPAKKPKPLTRLLSYNYFKKCPICNHEFHITTDDFEIYTHIENCVASSDTDHSVPPEPDQYKCPQCNQQIANSDEVYSRHLNECYNKPKPTDNF